MLQSAAAASNAAAFAVFLLLLCSGARAQRTLHIANTVTPPGPFFVYSQSIGGYLTTAGSSVSTPISIASSSTTLFFARSSFDSRCKVTIDTRFDIYWISAASSIIQLTQNLTFSPSASDAAVVISSLDLSPTGFCARSVVFNADGVDLTDIDMNRARVAMTSDSFVLQAFYGQSS